MKQTTFHSSGIFCFYDRALNTTQRNWRRRNSSNSLLTWLNHGLGPTPKIKGTCGLSPTVSAGKNHDLCGVSRMKCESMFILKIEIQPAQCPA